MIRSQLDKLTTSPAKLHRGLAILLLACVCWGATAEFTHHHGTLPQPVQRVTTTASDGASANELQSSNNGRTSSRNNSRAECLICQLHQNLSSSEINQPFLIGAHESEGSFISTNVAVHLFDLADTHRGRAPPTIL